jgi:phosphatidate cytidylyltransferase
MSSIAKRLLTAIVLLPAIVLAIHIDRLLLFILLAIIAVLGARELIGLFRARGVDPPVWLAAICAVLLSATHLPGSVIDAVSALFFVIAASLVVQLIRSSGKMLLEVSGTVFAALYAGLLPGYLLRFYDLPGGAPDPWPVTFALLLVWGCDTGAYVVGSVIGRHKLWPRISPGKTWEGAAGGLIAAVALAIAFGNWAGELTLAQRTIAGLLAGLFAQIGDLAESLMKREASIKDSGGTLPGHGGILDRLDSVVLAVPSLYYWLHLSMRMS